MARQVWLGNSRGNTYARRHVSLDSSSDAFWDFTWWASSQRCLNYSLNCEYQRQACTCDTQGIPRTQEMLRKWFLYQQQACRTWVMCQAKLFGLRYVQC